MEQLKTYKFYDNKHRRLSIFGEVKENEILISYFPCSKSDNFSKAEAVEAYEKGYITRYSKRIDFEEWSPRPLITQIPYQIEVNNITHLKIPLIDKPTSTFIQFCRDNFISKGMKTIITQKPYFYTRMKGN